MAVITDAIEGVIEDAVWFHYDLTADVLYLRLPDDRQTAALGEEQDDGTILLRAENDDRPVGLTVINWWQRFGDGTLPDSLQTLAERIAPWHRRLAA
jgi:hypothetical protein